MTLLKELKNQSLQTAKNFFFSPLQFIKRLHEKHQQIEKPTLRSFQLAAAAICSVFLHNAIFAFFRYEEPVFFSLFFFLLIAFALSLIHNVYTATTKGTPTDLWRLGWLGLLGLLGFHPRLGPAFYGFYGFFIFFGFKKQ